MMHVASPPMFQIFVKVKNGKSTTLWVERSDTINAVKSKVSEKEGVLAADLRLIFAGKDLEGTRALGDYNVRANNTLWLVVRVRGGMSDDGVLATEEERLSCIEGRLTEIELNYAVDQYADERDSLLHDEIEEEVAMHGRHQGRRC